MKAKKILPRNGVRPGGACLSILFITCCCQTLHATDWNGSASNDWNVALNWSGAAVPTAEDSNIFAGESNFPVISATPTGAPKAVWIGNYGAATGRLDLTGGTLTVTSTDWPGGPLIIGYGQDGKGTCNIANTATGGGAFTGYGTGTGSFTSGSFGDIRVGSGYWWGNSTGVLNVNTTGTVHANGHLAIGGGNGDVGTVNVDAGTITIGGGWQTSVDIASGSATSPSSGNLNISGGTLSMDHRLVIAGGFRSGAGTEADPYVYANGSYVGTVTMTGGTLTTDATHNENWHGGLSMAAGSDEAIGGTATFNLNGGTLSTLFVFTEAGNGGVAGTSTFNFNGGTLQGQANYGQFMGGLTRANVRDGGAVIDTNGNDLFISQVLEHSDIDGDAAVDGGLTKNGIGLLDITGGFTYTGNTTVNGGTLRVHQVSFDDASTIKIASGATLGLDTGGSIDTVGVLIVGGVGMAPGVYRATDANGGSGEGTQLAELLGNGKLDIASAGPAGYSTWAGSNVNGDAPGTDSNHDGVANGIAYFMNNTGVIRLPGLVGGAVTWTNGGSIAAAQYGTQFVIQTSQNLVTWTNVPSASLTTNTDGPGGSLTYTLPTGQSKSFVRLVVTPN